MARRCRLNDMPRECLSAILAILDARCFANACISCRAFLEASKLKESLKPAVEWKRAKYQLKQSAIRLLSAGSDEERYGNSRAVEGEVAALEDKIQDQCSDVRLGVRHSVLLRNIDRYLDGLRCPRDVAENLLDVDGYYPVYERCTVEGGHCRYRGIVDIDATGMASVSLNISVTPAKRGQRRAAACYRVTVAFGHSERDPHGQYGGGYMQRHGGAFRADVPCDALDGAPRPFAFVERSERCVMDALTRIIGVEELDSTVFMRWLAALVSSHPKRWCPLEPDESENSVVTWCGESV
ncbi:unnamed protein product [Ostreobium quekettii]|uniref:F-box domain-containing protein n=1 Tax=Ostreobium quekettii TaxID=121088 RepID=A0A8S1IT78_9CHLO|nr:unnamed protein product [Ostreobium quekettii]